MTQRRPTKPPGQERRPSPKLRWHLRLLLASFPPWWRRRYDDEMRATLLALRRAGPWRDVRDSCDLVRGLVAAWLDPTQIPSEQTMTDRTTSLVPSAGWGLLLFVVAGSGFAKVVEDPPFAAAARQHPLLGWWVDGLVVAAVATALVMAAATVPSVVVLLRQNPARRRRDLAPLAVVPVSAACLLTTLVVTRDVADGTAVHAPSHVAAFVALALVAVLSGAASTLALVRVAIRVPDTPTVDRSRSAAMVATGVLITAGALGVAGWTVTAAVETPNLLRSRGGLLATSTTLTLQVVLAGLVAAAALCGRSAIGAGRTLSSRGAAPRSSR